LFLADDLAPWNSSYQAYHIHILVHNVSRNSQSSNESTLVPYLEQATLKYQFPLPPNCTIPFNLHGSDIPIIDLLEHDWFELRTHVNITSDQSLFYFVMSREILQNQTSLMKIEWKNNVTRQFQ